MNEFSIDRRRLIQAAGVAGAAGATTLLASKAFAGGKPLTVGVLYSGAKNDFGWNQAHALATAKLKTLPGVKVVEEERVPETVAAQKAMEGMIVQDGASLIIATSYGYFQPHVLKMAEKYPRVTFAHCGGIWSDGMPTNISTFYGYIFTSEYISGIVAGHMTKTKKLGIVAAKPTPNLLRSINAFTLGARSVNPKITVNLIFTGDWVLPVREAESTNSLIDQGVDVISCIVDSPKVVVETATKRGVMTCGYHSSQAALAPKTYLTGAEWNWIVPYTEIVKRVAGGQPPVHYLRGGLKDGFVRNAPFGPAVSAGARRAAETARAKLLSGALDIFTGPLKDNKGNTVIPAGVRYEENNHALDGINYLVDGVIG